MRLHSILIALTALSVSIISQQIALPAMGWSLVFLGLGVALVGVPHGALDSRFGPDVVSRLGSRLDRLWVNRHAFSIFLGGYLAVLCTVIFGWYVIPTITIGLFFLLAAIHFGLEEDERPAIGRWQWAPLAARGGMAIWIPAVCFSDQVAGLLETIVPATDHVGTSMVAILFAISPLLGILTLADLWGHFPHPGGRMHAIRVVALALLFATAPPLVSFGIYFCGWHSVRGLVHLREQLRCSTRELLYQLLPLSFVSILLFFAGGTWYLWQQVPLEQTVLKTLFIGLSAIAIPHLLLHSIQDAWSVEGGRPTLAQGKLGSV